MLRAAVKSLLGHKLRLATTALAVLLGVGFMSASLVLTDSVTKAFDSLFVDLTRNVDAVVQARAAFDTQRGIGGALQPVPASTLATVRGVPGVRAAEGNVVGVALLLDGRGKLTANPQFGGTAGLNWQETPAFNHFDLVDGRAPRGGDEVVIDKATADRTGLGVGDRTTLLRFTLLGGPPGGAQTGDGGPTGDAPTVPVRVVGVARFEGNDDFGGFGFVAMQTADAERNFLAAGQLTNITVQADPGVSQTRLVAALRSRLPDSVEVLTGARYTAEQQQNVQGAIKVLTQVFVAFALLSLLAAVFLIYNTFSIIVAQRTRELALLRALGASRRQVTGSVLVESVAVGLAGSVAGLVGGIGLAVALKSVFANVGAGLPASPNVVEPRTVVVALAVGLVVTVVSAVVPARQAARVPPVAAMRDVAIDEADQSRSRRAVGVVLVALAVVALVVGAATATLAVSGTGGGLLLVGLIVLGPVLAPRVGRGVGWVMARSGTAGHLARENAVRNPRRTAATSTVLVISLTLIATLLVLVASFLGTIGDTFRARFDGQFVLDSQSFGGGGGVSPALASRVAALPQVDVVSGVRTGQAQVFGHVERVAFVDPATIERIVDVGPTQGTLRTLGADGLAVNPDIAKAHDLHVGDKVPVRWASGQVVETTVVAIYTNASSITQNQDPFLMGIPAAERYLPNTAGDVRVLVRDRPGVPDAEARAAIERITQADFPQVKVLDTQQVTDQATKNFDQFLGFFLLLLGLTVVIGLLGIVNTMLLSIHERTRELGLLRAVGMTRRQLGASISMESVIIALLGTLLGIVAGIALATSIMSAARDDLMGARVVVPWGRLAFALALTVVAGVLAAAWPARRAVKLDVLDAIGTE